MSLLLRKKLHTQQRLVVGKQGGIDLINIITVFFQIILHDDIQRTACRKNITGLPQQRIGFRHIQTQSHGKRKYRGFAGLVQAIAPDLGKVLPVYIGFFVGFGIRQSFFVDQLQQGFRERGIQLPQAFGKIAGLGGSARIIIGRFLYEIRVCAADFIEAELFLDSFLLP